MSEMRPRVIFVDSLSWECAAALAGALRHHGVAVQRLTAPPHGLKTRVLQDLERLIYGRTRRLSCLEVRPPAQDQSKSTASPSPVPLVAPLESDVQIQDELRPRIGADCAGAILGEDALAAAVRPGVDPTVLYDKRSLAQVARAAAVPVPAYWDTPTCDQFPAVVKAPIGSSGVGVQTVRDQRELSLAWQEIGELGMGSPFVQAFHRGEMRSAGVAHYGELRLSVEYRSHPPSNNPNGAPVQAQVIENVAVRELTERFIGAVGFSGMFCLDWVLNDHGEPLLIDFNPRSFGSWPALQELGVDFVGAYLQNLGLGSGPQERAVVHGVSASVLLFPLPATSSWGELRSVAGGSWRLVRRREAWLGTRWGLVSRVKIIAATGIESAALLRRRSSGRMR